MGEVECQQITEWLEPFDRYLTPEEEPVTKKVLDAVGRVANAARAEGRREGMEAACKTVCSWCRQDVPLRGHAHDFGDGRLAGCEASAIRRAMEVPDEQSE